MSKPSHRRRRACFGVRAHAFHAAKKPKQRRFADFRRRRLALTERELDQEMRAA